MQPDPLTDDQRLISDLAGFIHAVQRCMKSSNPRKALRDLTDMISVRMRAACQSLTDDLPDIAGEIRRAIPMDPQRSPASQPGELGNSLDNQLRLTEQEAQ